MKKLTLFATLALLSACDRNRSGAEDVVRTALKDPDSARFGEFYYNDKTEKGCLTVNAKNSMGGYTGDQQAYVQHTKDGWESIGSADIPASMCRETHADTVPEKKD